MRIAAVLCACTLLGAASVQASTKGEAQVKAAKGPIEITLRLEKTQLKLKRALWYKIELKNIGKKKLRIDDWIFKDPWAMYENCRSRSGIYLEVIDPEGEPMTVRAGGDRVHFDWEAKGDASTPYTPDEKKELVALRAEWKKRGLTEQRESIAMSAWLGELVTKRDRAESSDPAKQFWLEPGASTTTFAWSDRGPGAYAGRSEDDESLRGGYTQLWGFRFLDPGKYRIRAVYKHQHPGTRKDLTKEYGYAPEPWWITFETPPINFVVLP